ncbi:MAG: putative molybdenum carrier protein [Verrucomicrobiae bacterium]|nr:putative molybdenum carrier protein [Verrucomicrobiae bacterium]MCP5540148.1 putative molybdenum carrier protein [Akkermansiaceae bacterium]
MFPERIVSGGQTGADRAALDWAIARGIPHGGWCPEGRLAEDGPIDPRYELRETPGAVAYIVRTEWNVRDADATVIFSLAPRLTGGSLATRDLARRRGKPVLHLSRAKSVHPEVDLARFMDDYFVRVLNVAGPRASTEPGVAAFVRETLDAAFPSASDPGPEAPHSARPG